MGHLVNSFRTGVVATFVASWRELELIDFRPRKSLIINTAFRQYALVKFQAQLVDSTELMYALSKLGFCV